MKYVAMLIALVSMVGCASGPSLIMVKNCKELGSNSGLFQCEEIPQREFEGKR